MIHLIHKILLLTGLTAALFHLCHGEYIHTVYIDPRNGKDSNECGPDNPCLTLHWAFINHRNNSTKYLLLDGVHNLSNSTLPFTNLNNIAFEGDSKPNSRVFVWCSAQETGLAFINVENIYFSSITFENCSATRDSTSRNFSEDAFKTQQFKAALYFYHCSNVSMYHVKVLRSPNATGVVMYDTDGTNNIIRSNFSENVVLDGATLPGGGGFYVEFSYCIPGDSKCNDTQSDPNVATHVSRNTDAHYNFSECFFSYNRANTSESAKSQNITFVIPYRAEHEAFGRGGGLSIFLKGNSTRNSFSISNCQFIDNRAKWGGGLFIEFHDEASDNLIHISDSRFYANSCPYTTDFGTSGGGMRIGHFIYGYNALKSSIPPTNISLEYCTFDSNNALNGGGLSISAALQDYSVSSISHINISNTTFIKNTAKIGAAVHVDRFMVFIQGHMLLIFIANGTFMNNSVEYGNQFKNMPREVGLGTLYTHQVKVAFLGSTNFSYNNGTALAAISSKLDFTNCNDAEFVTNRGLKGGAIALYGSSVIQVGEFTEFGIYNNIAKVHGGGIYNQYIAKENLKSYTDCFLQYYDPFPHPNDWGATFYFFNNKDQGGTKRNAIHTTSVLPCSFASGSDKEKIFFWRGWNYAEVDGRDARPEDVISSDVGDIDYSGTNSKSSNFITAHPGIPFDLPLAVVDDYNSSITSQSIFSANINSSLSNIGEYDLNFTFVQGDSTIVKGSDNHQRVVLELDNLGDRVWHAEVIVELLPCPPGFKANHSKKLENTFCDCAHSYGGALICDPEASKAWLRNGNWMGKLKEGNGTYLSAVCPPGYCYETQNSSLHFHLPSNYEQLDELICGSMNRNGTLCGRCIEGFGPAVNSLTYECVNCTDENIAANTFKYISSVYIPLTFLFTLLILFDIRLTSAPANAFILYCQVVSGTFDVTAGGQIPLNLYVGNAVRFLKAYQFPYAIFNLEFIENFLPPLCLGTELNNLSVFLLDYAVALCPLFMILFVILGVKVWICIAPKIRGTGENRRWERIRSISFSASYRLSSRDTERKGISEAVIPAFAAFLLLSYTKFSLSSAYILSYRWLLNETGNEVSTARVYFAGHLSYSSRDYLIPYFLPACLIFITIALLTPLLLLDYPLRGIEWALSKVKRLWRFYPREKIHVLLHTFQGCYKEKMKFFAGLYFLFRLTICLGYLAIDTWLDQFIMQQIACFIMVMLLAICQPYNEENKIFNYVDTLIFLNLAAINVLSLYLLDFTRYNPNFSQSVSAFAIQYILLYLPLIYMICYVMWSISKPYYQRLKARIRDFYQKMKQKRYQKLDDVTDGETSTASVTSPSRYYDDRNDTHADFEALFARAELENTYRPSPTAAVDDSEAEHKKSVRFSIQSDPSYLHYYQDGIGITGTNGSTMDSEYR